jgi:hypothetical protein
MNPRSRNIRIRQCILCAYPFADAHHVVPPEGRGCSELARLTLLLCPNHHRLANMVQAWAAGGVPDEEIQRFADAHFDADFNRRLLPALLEVRPETFEADTVWEHIFGPSGLLRLEPAHA